MMVLAVKKMLLMNEWMKMRWETVEMSLLPNQLQLYEMMLWTTTIIKCTSIGMLAKITQKAQLSLGQPIVLVVSDVQGHPRSMISI